MALRQSASGTGAEPPRVCERDAYAVHGTGTGEPDYQDAMVFGYGLDGTLVYENEEQW